MARRLCQRSTVLIAIVQDYSPVSSKITIAQGRTTPRILHFYTNVEHRANSVEDAVRRGQRHVEQVKLKMSMQMDDKTFQACLLETQVRKISPRYRHTLTYIRLCLQKIIRNGTLIHCRSSSRGLYSIPNGWRKRLRSRGSFADLCHFSILSAIGFQTCPGARYHLP